VDKPLPYTESTKTRLVTTELCFARTRIRAEENALFLGFMADYAASGTVRRFTANTTIPMTVDGRVEEGLGASTRSTDGFDPFLRIQCAIYCCSTCARDNPGLTTHGNPGISDEKRGKYLAS
jgi:hypothetical protein